MNYQLSSCKWFRTYFTKLVGYFIKTSIFYQLFFCFFILLVCHLYTESFCPSPPITTLSCKPWSMITDYCHLSHGSQPRWMFRVELMVNQFAFGQIVLTPHRCSGPLMYHVSYQFSVDSGGSEQWSLLFCLHWFQVQEKWIPRRNVKVNENFPQLPDLLVF